MVTIHKRPDESPLHPRKIVETQKDLDKYGIIVEDVCDENTIPPIKLPTSFRKPCQLVVDSMCYYYF